MVLPVFVAWAWTPICCRDDWIPSRKSGEAHDLERNTVTVAVTLAVIALGVNESALSAPLVAMIVPGNMPSLPPVLCSTLLWKGVSFSNISSLRVNYMLPPTYHIVFPPIKT